MRSHAGLLNDAFSWIRELLVRRSQDPPTLKETNENYDERNDQQQVNHSTDRTHGAEGPEHEQNNHDSPEEPVSFTRHGVSAS